VGRKIPSICIYCAGGCGVLATVIDDAIIEIEGDPDHPINEGALCSKAAAYIQLVNNDRRLLTPMKRTNPRKGVDEDPGWVPITWEEAFKMIAELRMFTNYLINLFNSLIKCPLNHAKVVLV
jgi:molybdopterin-containing oxidoreductase family molybdopterin binding subunit